MLIVSQGNSTVQSIIGIKQYSIRLYLWTKGIDLSAHIAEADLRLLNWQYLIDVYLLTPADYAGMYGTYPSKTRREFSPIFLVLVLVLFLVLL